MDAFAAPSGDNGEDGRQLVDRKMPSISRAISELLQMRRAFIPTKENNQEPSETPTIY